MNVGAAFVPQPARQIGPPMPQRQKRTDPHVASILLFLEPGAADPALSPLRVRSAQVVLMSTRGLLFALWTVQQVQAESIPRARRASIDTTAEASGRLDAPAASLRAAASSGGA